MRNTKLPLQCFFWKGISSISKVRRHYRFHHKIHERTKTTKTQTRAYASVAQAQGTQLERMIFSNDKSPLSNCKMVSPKFEVTVSPQLQDHHISPLFNQDPTRVTRPTRAPIHRFSPQFFRPFSMGRNSVPATVEFELFSLFVFLISKRKDFTSINL